MYIRRSQLHTFTARILITFLLFFLVKKFEKCQSVNVDRRILEECEQNYDAKGIDVAQPIWS